MLLTLFGMLKVVRFVSIALGLFIVSFQLNRGFLNPKTFKEATQPQYSFVLQDGERREGQPTAVTASISRPQQSSENDKIDETNPASNSTLGFSSIVALTSRTPSWRKSGLLRAASLTGLSIRPIEEPHWTPADVDAFESVRNETISRGAAQAWMSHVNALQLFLNSTDTTTLILEDDADWDVHIKQQMADVSLHLQDHYASPTSGLQIDPADLSPDNPYGISTWDILWLGHCGDLYTDHRTTDIYRAEPPSPNPNSTSSPNPPSAIHHQNTTISYHDSTAPPPSLLSPTFPTSLLLPSTPSPNNNPLPITSPPPLRALTLPASPICTFAYALHRSSASLLLPLVTAPNLTEDAFDVRLYSLCRWGGLRCLGVLPEVFHHQMVGGVRGGGSLIRMVDGEGEGGESAEGGDDEEGVGKKGEGRKYTANIRVSARCNSEDGEEAEEGNEGGERSGLRTRRGKAGGWFGWAKGWSGGESGWKTCLPPPIVTTEAKSGDTGSGAG
ncbi:MAG: hypothetical protein Q9227_008583 [Pyrenula ochraceoflavens]